MLAQSDAAAAQGALFDDGHQLSKLIGRPTTKLRDLLIVLEKAPYEAQIGQIQG
jgi:hypothetical protein